MTKTMSKITKKYSGQVLAIVLVVLFVGVIIALALLARTMSDQRQAVEERGSADSLEIADTVLTSVQDLELDEMIGWFDDSSVCDDGDGVFTDFETDGCTLDIEEFEQFCEFFEIEEYYDSVIESMMGTCEYSAVSDIDDSFVIYFRFLDEDDFLEIEKDSVFSFVFKSDNTNACTVELSAKPIEDDPAGIVYTSIYGTASAGELTNYKPYDFSDIIGQCINGDCDSSSNFLDWNTSSIDSNSLQKNTFNNIKSFSGTNYSLYELRVRPVGADILLARGGTCPMEQYVWMESIVNCKGSSRGKYFVLSNEDWAPALFDYVLFNGEGNLQYSND